MEFISFFFFFLRDGRELWQLVISIKGRWTRKTVKNHWCMCFRPSSSPYNLYISRRILFYSLPFPPPHPNQSRPSRKRSPLASAPLRPGPYTMLIRLVRSGPICHVLDSPARPSAVRTIHISAKPLARSVRTGRDQGTNNRANGIQRAILRAQGGSKTTVGKRL